MDVEAVVIKSLQSKSKVDLSQIDMKSSIGHLGIDSLHVTQVIMEIEESGGYSFSDEDVEAIYSISTVGGFIDAISAAIERSAE